MFNLKEGVDISEYEEWAKTRDIPKVNGLGSVNSFTVHRATGVFGDEKATPHFGYIEIIDITGLDAFVSDISSDDFQQAAAPFHGFADNPEFILTKELQVSKLHGKTIVVTGYGKQKGLGQAILQRFADDGANCVVSDREIDGEAEDVAQELRERGAEVETIACDVSNATQCRALVAKAVEAFESLDILVNNAGIGFKIKPLLDVDTHDEWDQVIAVNLSGAFYCMRAAARDG